MKLRLLKVILIILIFLFISLSFLVVADAFFMNKYNDIYSFTKAICNENNYCEDFEIICDGGRVSSIVAITGASVQFSSNWGDFRTEKQKNKLCE